MTFISFAKDFAGKADCFLLALTETFRHPVGKNFFLPFWIVSVSFLLTLLLLVFLFGESFSFFFWGYETKETFGWSAMFLEQKGSRVWGTELQTFFHLQSSTWPERKDHIPAPLQLMGNTPPMGWESYLRNPNSLACPPNKSYWLCYLCCSSSL